MTELMKNEIITGLLDIFSDNILTIISYGSVARNENTPESDIDIAIVIKNNMDDDTRDKFKRWSADMDLKYDKIFSIIDIEKSNLENWGHILPFYKNVKKEGIVLWKAA